MMGEGESSYLTRKEGKSNVGSAKRYGKNELLFRKEAN